LMSACAWSGKRYTNERTSERIPAISVSRKGHSVLSHNYKEG
jgi:hypothetical protein